MDERVIEELLFDGSYQDALEILLFMLHPKGRSFATSGDVPHVLCDFSVTSTWTMAKQDCRAHNAWLNWSKESMPD
jgi:hypothetical protein